MDFNHIRGEIKMSDLDADEEFIDEDEESE